MQINNFTKTYSVYSIRDNTNQNIYIGSTQNLTSRINTHISSFKSNNSSCSSVKVLKNDNYTIDVLISGLDKEDAKHSELNFINAYGNKCVNNNKPMIITLKEYQQLYNKRYRDANKKITVIDLYCN